MAVDVVAELSKLKNAYARARGGLAPTGLTNRSTGRPLFTPGKLVPATTWGDVWVVYQHLFRYVDPTPEQCREAVREQLRTDLRYRDRAKNTFGDRSLDELAFTICSASNPASFIGGNLSPRLFVRTSGFRRALKDFKDINPADKLGTGVIGLANLLAKVPKGEVYPHNEEFWGYADDLIRERSAAGEIPTWQEMAVASVNEAVAELPDTLKDVGKTVLTAVDPRSLIPDVRPWVDLIKWGSVAAGVGILWWYVIRPEAAKREARKRLRE